VDVGVCGRFCCENVGVEGGWFWECWELSWPKVALALVLVRDLLR
jgi:hypothetical protein